MSIAARPEKSGPEKQSRIQRKNRKIIREAALEVFSMHGFRGSTLDQIADKAGLSKPNILYYYQGKEEIYSHLLADILTLWLTSLEEINADGDPIAEILTYVETKLKLSQTFARESRLFANEILQGAKRMPPDSQDYLRGQVQRAVGVISRWIADGRIAEIDPHHLLFSIWASTQHYADFESQIALIFGPERDRAATFADAKTFLLTQYRKLLTPQ
jgi:TetR/AcrR family transcriptional regulator